jgi:hypothetical protein
VEEVIDVSQLSPDDTLEVLAGLIELGAITSIEVGERRPAPEDRGIEQAA